MKLKKNKKLDSELCHFKRGEGEPPILYIFIQMFLQVLLIV